MSTEKMPEEASHIFDDAGTHYGALVESVREFRDGHRGLALAIQNYEEMPLRLHLHEQAEYVFSIVQSAQAYRRDLLRLLNLAEEDAL